MCNLDPPDGYGTQFQSRERTAKKLHKCNECPNKIKPGEKYWYYVGLWEGDFFAHKWCQRCLKAKKWMESMGHSDWEGGSLLENVRYCAQEEKDKILAEAKLKRTNATNRNN